MDDIQILSKIINAIRENKNAAPLNNINESTNLRDDLNFDSLDLAEFTVRLEEEFNVDVFEDGIVTTVGEILNKIKMKDA